MTEEEGYCSIHSTPLVDEMDVESFETVDLNGGFEIRKRVDLSLVFPPVIAILPVCCQSFDICQWRSIVPASLIKFVGQGGSFELLGEVPQLAVRD